MSEEIQLNLILRDLINGIEGMQSAAIVSKEGLIVFAINKTGVKDDKTELCIAAASAILLSTCEKVTKDLVKIGDLDICIIQGSDGKFIVMECGEENIIVCVFDDDARMDAVFINMRNTAAKIVDLFSQND